MRTRSFFSLSLYCVMSACASSHNAQQPSEQPGNGSAIVIKGSDLSGSVLQGIRNRIPSMRVTNDPNSRCPRIIFRATHSINNQRDPSVYIDGTHMMDTCSLMDIAANDVDHVEVYVSGNTPYPQIERNPFGLILIFRRQE